MCTAAKCILCVVCRVPVWPVNRYATSSFRCTIKNYFRRWYSLLHSKNVIAPCPHNARNRHTHTHACVRIGKCGVLWAAALCQINRFFHSDEYFCEERNFTTDEKSYRRIIYPNFWLPSMTMFERSEFSPKNCSRSIHFQIKFTSTIKLEAQSMTHWRCRMKFFKVTNLHRPWTMIPRH